VRDVAAAHVAAFEKPEAAGKRFFIVEGSYCRFHHRALTLLLGIDVIKVSNQQIVDIIAKNFPEYKDRLPTERAPNDGFDFAEGEVYTVDNSRSKEVLGLKYHTFEESVVGTVKSLQELGL
jgi:nucleoside-diphosphate-sugar epimerase